MLQLFSALKIFGSSIHLPRRVGTATLVLGTVTIPDAEITNNDIIFLTAQNGGILSGIVRVSARVPGVSFTITSTILTDSAVIGYLIF